MQLICDTCIIVRCLDGTVYIVNALRHDTGAQPGPSFIKHIITVKYILFYTKFGGS